MLEVAVEVEERITHDLTVSYTTECLPVSGGSTAVSVGRAKAKRGRYEMMLAHKSMCLSSMDMMIYGVTEGW